MRLHFQQRPWDLYATLGYTVAVAAMLLALNLGNLFAVLLVLFIPGYVLVAALFPGAMARGRPEVDWIERVGISFGLSIAVIPLLGLILNFTPWGVRFEPLVATITVFTIGVGCVAYWRRMGLPIDRRLSLTIEFGLPDWEHYSTTDKCLTIALAASIAVAGGIAAYVVLTPLPGETFTEFYILGPGSNASDYPTALNISQTGTVVLGVANHESASVDYILRIDLVGVRRVYNATSGLNETVEVNSTTWSTFSITLANGQNWSRPYSFRIDGGGLWMVRFLLFRDYDFSSVYRELHFFIRVT